MRRHYYSEHPELVSLKWGDFNKLLDDLDVENNREFNQLLDDQLKTISDNAFKESKINFDVIDERIETTSPMQYGFNVNGIDYVLTFSKCTIHNQTKLVENLKLINIVKSKLLNHQYFNCIEIELDYSPPNINKTRSDLSYLIEFINRFCFILNNFIEKEKEIDIYYVGKNDLLNKYIDIFNKIYNNYLLFEGDCEYYRNGAYYFINKSILK